MTRIPQTSAQWPDFVAAAGAWWEEADAGAPRRVEPQGSRKVEEPEWTGVATAALAWWEGTPQKSSRRAPIVKARARDAEPAQWPEVAAAAGVWWEESFESGVYAKTKSVKTVKTYVA